MSVGKLGQLDHLDLLIIVKIKPKLYSKLALLWRGDHSTKFQCLKIC